MIIGKSTMKNYGPHIPNVKNLSELQASNVIEEWLDNCNKLRKLDFEPKTKVHNIIKGNKGYKPISFARLKDENKALFLLLEGKTTT